jgi:hypothetical protein
VVDSQLKMTEDEPRGDLLYEERPPWGIGDVRMKPMDELRRETWILRGLVYFALFLVVFNALTSWITPMQIVFTFLSITLVFTLVCFFEWTAANNYRTAAPVMIYDGGVLVFATFLERKLGFDGFIDWRDITGIKVVRAEAVVAKGEGLGFHYKWAPIRIEISTKGGKVRHSGKKVPETILEMVRIMQSTWRLTAFDPGEGLGEFEIIDRSLRRKKETP